MDSKPKFIELTRKQEGNLEKVELLQRSEGIRRSSSKLKPEESIVSYIFEFPFLRALLPLLSRRKPPLMATKQDRSLCAENSS
ncbi:hypothetical protein U1Q18_017455 [Sarracenia purpurea var. burkii]